MRRDNDLLRHAKKRTTRLEHFIGAVVLISCFYVINGLGFVISNNPYEQLFTDKEV